MNKNLLDEKIVKVIVGAGRGERDRERERELKKRKKPNNPAYERVWRNWLIVRRGWWGGWALWKQHRM